MDMGDMAYMDYGATERPFSTIFDQKTPFLTRKKFFTMKSLLKKFSDEEILPKTGNAPTVAEKSTERNFFGGEISQEKNSDEKFSCGCEKRTFGMVDPVAGKIRCAVHSPDHGRQAVGAGGVRGGVSSSDNSTPELQDFATCPQIAQDATRIDDGGFVCVEAKSPRRAWEIATREPRDWVRRNGWMLTWGDPAPAKEPLAITKPENAVDGIEAD